MNEKVKVDKPRVFLENPYDIETFFESLSISTDHDKELLFVDRLLSNIRLDPAAELTDVCYKVLKELNVLTTK